MKGKQPIRIVYEDSDLIVIEKAAGIPSVAPGNGPAGGRAPSGGGKAVPMTAYSLLMDYVREGGRRPRERVFIVHRLDRETSGLLVFARNGQTKHALQDNWHEVVLERRYTAVTEGCPAAAEGRIRTWLTESPKSLKVHSCAFDNGGKEAVSDFRVVARSGRHAMLEFELETGRKNQIRVHAAHIGCPIVGDRKYGAAECFGGRIALHAGTLVFIHPWTGRTMRFSSRVPRAFLDLMDDTPRHPDTPLRHPEGEAEGSAHNTEGTDSSLTLRMTKARHPDTPLRHPDTSPRHPDAKRRIR